MSSSTPALTPPYALTPSRPFRAAYSARAFVATPWQIDLTTPDNNVAPLVHTAARITRVATLHGPRGAIACAASAARTTSDAPSKSRAIVSSSFIASEPPSTPNLANAAAPRPAANGFFTAGVTATGVPEVSCTITWVSCPFGPSTRVARAVTTSTQGSKFPATLAPISPHSAANDRFARSVLNNSAVSFRI